MADNSLSARFERINAEVFRAPAAGTTVSEHDLDGLVSALQDSPRGRVRICAHGNDTDLLQEMFIVLSQNVYIRPHKHINKPESIYVLRGRVDLITFRDDGEILDIIRMDDGANGLTRYSRIARPIFHTLRVRSPYLLIHEVTTGPFLRSDTLYAAWSPEEADTDAHSELGASIDRRIAQETIAR